MRIDIIIVSLGLTLQYYLQNVNAFISSTKLATTASKHNKSLFVTSGEDENMNVKDENRRVMILNNMIGLASLCLTSFSGSASARVEGYAPPTKSLSEEYRQGTAVLADMDENAPVPKEAYIKLPSGVIYADIKKGNGESIDAGSRVNMQWVLRKSNGYFVDSSEVQGGVPFIFTVGDGSAIAGLDEAVRGMKAGGTRRILMPPSKAYVDGLDDGKPGPLPAGFGPRQQMRRVQNIRKDVPGEYVFLEVQVTRVR